MQVSDLIKTLIGPDTVLPIRIEAYDGSGTGPTDSETTINIKSPKAIHRIITARGQEIGFSRAIVAGEIDIEGDIYGIFKINRALKDIKINWEAVRWASKLLGIKSPKDFSKLKPLDPPPEEITPKGKLHSKARDKEVVSGHYDASNEFYEKILDGTWTYSCGIFNSVDDSLQQAQDNKHDLICRKLNLQPGQRHLDIGCGWGSMAIHAAKNYGVSTLGVTLSEEQAIMARQRVEEAGLSDKIEIRIQDYREIPDDPFDAISSIGMAEHVGGPHQMTKYFSTVRELLKPEGRYLNHAIGQAAGQTIASKGGFIQKYVFPDGRLHEFGSTITMLQNSGFEARHAETFRLHYAKTLRRWVTALEENWDFAVDEVGEGRAKVWWIYMAGSAVAFELGEIELHHVLGIRNDAPNESIPILPDWT